MLYGMFQVSRPCACFSKGVHYVPLAKLPTALETTNLLVAHVFRLHDQAWLLGGAPVTLRAGYLYACGCLLTHSLSDPSPKTYQLWETLPEAKCPGQHSS